MTPHLDERSIGSDTNLQKEHRLSAARLPIKPRSHQATEIKERLIRSHQNILVCYRDFSVLFFFFFGTQIPSRITVGLVSGTCRDVSRADWLERPRLMAAGGSHASLNGHRCVPFGDFIYLKDRTFRRLSRLFSSSCSQIGFSRFKNVKMSWRCSRASFTFYLQKVGLQKENSTYVHACPMSLENFLVI